MCAPARKITCSSTQQHQPHSVSTALATAQLTPAGAVAQPTRYDTRAVTGSLAPSLFTTVRHSKCVCESHSTTRRKTPGRCPQRPYTCVLLYVPLPAHNTSELQPKSYLCLYCHQLAVRPVPRLVLHLSRTASPIGCKVLMPVEAVVHWALQQAGSQGCSCCDGHAARRLAAKPAHPDKSSPGAAHTFKLSGL